MDKGSISCPRSGRDRFRALFVCNSWRLRHKDAISMYDNQFHQSCRLNSNIGICRLHFGVARIRHLVSEQMMKPSRKANTEQNMIGSRHDPGCLVQKQTPKSSINASSNRQMLDGNFLHRKKRSTVKYEGKKRSWNIAVGHGGVVHTRARINRRSK